MSKPAQRKSTANISNGGAPKEDVAPVGGGRRRGVITIGGNTASPTVVVPRQPIQESAFDEHHQNLTRTDFQRVFSPKVHLDELTMPQGLKFRPLMPSADVAHDHVQAQLWGLPGALKMDYATSQKYFGASARDRFFDRYKWMDHQREITLKTPQAAFTQLYFEREKADPSAQQAFAPVRPHRQPLAEDDGDSRASSFQSRFKSDLSASGRANESFRLREAARRSGADSPDDFDELDEARMLEQMGLHGWEELAEDDAEDDGAAPLDGVEAPVFNPRALTLSSESRLEGAAPDNVVAASQADYRQHYARLDSRPATPTDAADRAGPTNQRDAAAVAAAPSKRQRPKTASAAVAAAEPPPAVAESSDASSAPTAAGRGLQGVRAQRRLRSAQPKRSDRAAAESPSLQRARQFVAGADHFSTLILEDQLRKRNVAAAPDEAAADAAPVAAPRHSATGGGAVRRGDQSVASASTVSTLGLLLGQRGFTGRDDVTRNVLESPRSRFIAGCIARKINPRASLLLRKVRSAARHCHCRR